jgi:hypothetical protein
MSLFTAKKMRYLAGALQRQMLTFFASKPNSII